MPSNKSNFPSDLSIALDIALSESGDLLISSSGDLEIVSDIEALQQEITFRLKTHVGDYLIQPQCGASLDTLIGQPNSDTTANLAKQLVIQALTHDDFIDPNNLEITVYPTIGVSNSIDIRIDLDLESQFQTSSLPGNSTAISITYTVDLQEGLLL